MTKRTAQREKTVGLPRQRTTRKLSRSARYNIERADLLILLGLAVVTFGVYAQVIGHRYRYR